MALFTQLNLDKARADNLGHQMVALSNDFSRRILSHYQQQGYGDIRPVHGALLRNLELAGNRLTTLAERAEVTHRAMTKIVADVEQLGYVERTPDPEDGRALVIRFTPAGRKLLDVSGTITEHVYSEYSSVAGPKTIASLETGLYKFLCAMDVQIRASGLQSLHSTRPAALQSDSTVYLSHNLGRYLQLAGDNYHTRCADLMAQRGHPGVRVDYVACLSHLSLEGMRLTELASSAGITLQAMGKQVKALEALDYVKVTADDKDMRVRRINFTPHGLVFIEALIAAFGALDKDYREIVGGKTMHDLQSSLVQVLTALEIEVPI